MKNHTLLIGTVALAGLARIVLPSRSSRGHAPVESTGPRDAQTSRVRELTRDADHWELYHYADGRWTWRNVGYEAARLSDQAFDSWIEAMADAINTGFKAGESVIALERESRRARPRLP